MADQKAVDAASFPLAQRPQPEVRPVSLVLSQRISRLDAGGSLANEGSVQPLHIDLATSIIEDM
jgi:hypothetical protein